MDTGNRTRKLPQGISYELRVRMAKSEKKDAELRKLAEQQEREMEEQSDRLNLARITEIRRRGSGYG